MTIETVILITIGALVCALVFGRSLFREQFPFKSRGTLLTPTELVFYKALKNALPPNLEIHNKVRLADIITVDDKDWSTHGYKISSKHLDFVVVDAASSHIQLAIELDDKSHDRPDRQARDGFVEKATAAAGVKLVRIKVQKTYDSSTLEQIFVNIFNIS